MMVRSQGQGWGWGTAGQLFACRLSHALGLLVVLGLLLALAR
jgi:hypothetical protein